MATPPRIRRVLQAGRAFALRREHMDTEIQRFKEAVEAVVAMLRRNKHLTSDEEDTITAETGRVRSELSLWRQRRPKLRPRGSV